jgi:hypothetical protein
MTVKTCNTEQLVGRWEDRRDVKNLAGKYVLSLLLKKEPTMLETFWSSRDDISMGVNTGWYVGRDALAAYYDSIDAATKTKAQLLKSYFKEDLGNMTDEELYGRGPLELRSLDNAIIEVATDGKTAKGMFVCFGLVTDLEPNGSISRWVFGTYCFDFIREGDQWKIWHLLYMEDVNEVAGQKWGVNSPAPYPEIPEWAVLKDIKIAQPNVPETLREHYHGMRPFTRLPKMPEPYDTFAETFSYGAESKEALA